jgi:hypothetical protein
MLPDIINAASAAGVYRLSEGCKVTEKAYDLQVAWLYWEALAGLRASGPIVAAEVFPQLVRQLARAPSHKARRDASRRFPYDVLIL